MYSSQVMCCCLAYHKPSVIIEPFDNLRWAKIIGEDSMDAMVLSWSLLRTDPETGVMDDFLPKGELKESEIWPPKIPSPKGSAFPADMRSRKKIFQRLAEFGRKLWGPGADSPEGVEKHLQSNKNSQNKSHFQDHLDERTTPRLELDLVPLKGLSKLKKV